MKKHLLFKSLLLLCALIVGTNVWADTVTLTENFSSSAASTNQYDCSSSISTAANQTNWNYAWTTSGSGTVFKNGIKLGKSNGTGSVANATMLSGIAKGTSITIKVYAARWNTDSGNLTVTYNGSSESKAPANSAITTTTNTYSSSDFSSSTDFTITKADAVTSFSIASSAKRILIDKVEVVYDEGDTKIDPTLSFPQASYDVDLGDEFVAPTLSRDLDGTGAVTYSSSNTNVATVNSTTGAVTVKSVGSTTITANVAADDKYKAGTAQYVLNVNFQVTDGVFDFEKAGAQDPLEDYGSEVPLSSDPYVTDKKTWVAVNVTMETSGKYRWWNADKTLRFYDTSYMEFSVPSGYVITKIAHNAGTLSSPNSGSMSGTSWVGASQSVKLQATGNFKSVTVTYTTANQTFTPGKTYTTLTCAYALDFTSVSSDLKAFIATEISEGKVQMTQVNKVPAGTGLVLKATTPGSAVNVPVFDGTSPDDVSGNKMAGSATATTDIAANGGYILKDGVFQPATAGTLAAGKAYLNISVGAGARALEMNFDDNETTGLSEVTNTNLTNNTNEVFDLQGRKVAQPTKGLYIVNGKKVIIK